MPRVTTAFAAALALFMPLGRPLLVGLTPAVGIGAGLLSTQAAYSMSAEDWFNSGLDKFDSEDYQGAISDYTRAIAIDPLYSDAYNSRGLARELSDPKGAIADFSKAIETNPQNADAYSNRAQLKLTLEDYQGALADFSIAIEINPKDSYSYLLRGVTKATELDDFQGAIDDYTKAIEINPLDADAYGNRAISKAELGDLKSAIADHDKSIMLDPDPLRYISRSITKFKMGDLEGRCADLKKAAEFDDSYFGRMSVYDVKEEC